MNQTEHTKFKKGVRGAKPPETLENFYVTANENYWNFIYFSFFPSIFLWFFPFANTSEKFQGGAEPPTHPPGYAPASTDLLPCEYEKFYRTYTFKAGLC